MIAKLGLSPRDRRTLVVGSCTVLSLITVAKGLPALRAWETQRAGEAEAAAEQLTSLREGLRVLPALYDSLRVRRLRLAALDSVLVFGESPSAVSARLAAKLEELADDNSIMVTALQLRSDSVVTNGLARIEVRVAGVTDITGLGGFLRAVEGNVTPLVVRDLSVSQQEPTAADSKPEALRIDLLIASVGWIKSAVRQ